MCKQITPKGKTIVSAIKVPLSKIVGKGSRICQVQPLRITQSYAHSLQRVLGTEGKWSFEWKVEIMLLTGRLHSPQTCISAGSRFRAVLYPLHKLSLHSSTTDTEQQRMLWATNPPAPGKPLESTGCPWSRQSRGTGHPTHRTPHAPTLLWVALGTPCPRDAGRWGEAGSAPVPRAGTPVPFRLWFPVAGLYSHAGKWFKRTNKKGVLA